LFSLFAAYLGEYRAKILNLICLDRHLVSVVEATHSPSLLSNRTLRRVLCRFGTYLHDGFGLLVKGTQLLAYKFGLDFHHVFQILRMTEFLYQPDSSRNIVRGIAE
jgi:hypothetical protein